MGYRICYIGNDAKFWKKLQGEVTKFIGPDQDFHQLVVDSSFDPGQSFIDLYADFPDIIYIDLGHEPDKALSLSKLLSRNNETRLKSLVLIHDHNVGYESLLRGILSGARLNYFKNVDMNELVYHPLSLLDPSFTHTEEYASGLKINDFKFKQIMRIGYICDDHYRVETNCQLEVEEIVELDTHPLEDIMPSNRFLPEKFSDSDLYYNQRYSYNFKYTYLNNDFFLASEKSWIKYKISGSRDRVQKLFEKSATFILDDVDRRSQALIPVRQDIGDWVDKHKSKVEPKRLKVLVVDETLRIFKEFLENVDNFKHTINFQTKLTKDFYQVRRSRPHLILFHFNNPGSGKSVLARVIEEIKKFKHYTPAIIVFNYHDNSEALKSLLEYENIICCKDDVGLEMAMKMAVLLNKKFHITDTEEKVFLKTKDPASVATCIRSGKILKFNESEMFFTTKLEIPMWTTFMLEQPLKALITVIPHGNEQEFDCSTPVYRALINGIGEIEKNNLRRLVNKSLG